MFDQFYKQRTMRANRLQAKRKGVVALVDLGSAKISCIVMRFDFENAVKAAESGSSTLSACKVIGFSSVPSKGLVNLKTFGGNQIINMLNLVLAKAQAVAKTRVDHVLVSMSVGNLQPVIGGGSTVLEEETVSEQDISQALYACEVPSPPQGREYLHVHPVNFSVDHRTGLHDPRGIAGNRLSVDLQMVTIDETALTNIIDAFECCDVQVAGVAGSPYVTGLATLVKQEQESGAACIDIGAACTGVSIFYKHHMVHVSVLPIGGDHITSDISQAFGITINEAEKLKVRHGSVMALATDDRYMCELQKPTGEVFRITRTELIGIIRPRVEEILDDVVHDLEKAEFNAVPGQSVVMTGGSIHLQDLEAVAKEKIGQSLRFGRPLRLCGLPQAYTGPEYSSTVGLCLHAAQPQDEFWDFPMAKRVSRMNHVERTMNWIKENW